MDTILQFDHSLIFYVHEHFVYSFLTPIMAFISKITSNGVLWIIIALLLMLSLIKLVKLNEEIYSEIHLKERRYDYETYFKAD